MKVILAEMKRIFRWQSWVIIVALIAVSLYFFFITGYITPQEIIRAYGTTEYMDVFDNASPYLFEPIGTSATVAAIMSVITVFGVCSPVLVSDNIAKMPFLQYSSKTGRKSLNGQLAAMLISTAVITAIQLFVLGFLISVIASICIDGGLIACLSVPFTYPEGLYFSGTIGQYLLIVVTLVFMLTLSFTLVIFFISKQSPNYVPMLLTGLSFTAAFSFGSFIVLRSTFATISGANIMLGNPLYEKFGIPYIEVYFSALVFIASASVGLYVLREYKRGDITN